MSEAKEKKVSAEENDINKTAPDKSDENIKSKVESEAVENASAKSDEISDDIISQKENSQEETSTEAPEEHYLTEDRF